MTRARRLVLALPWATTAALAQAPKRELAPLSGAQDRARAVRHFAVPLSRRSPGEEQAVPRRDRRASGAATPRRAAASIGRTRPTATAASLLYIPRGFDPRRPALMVVFFHGNEATLDARRARPPAGAAAARRVRAQRRAGGAAIRRQRARLERRPVLGAGRVSRSSSRRRASGSRALYGDERARAAFVDAPVVIAAYSGGYNPAAFMLQAGGVDHRLRGVILLDALVRGGREIRRLARPAGRRRFFFSAYGKAARDDNAALQRMLTERNVRFQTALAGQPRARQRLVPRRQRRDQARRFRDARPGSRPAQGAAAPDRRLRARGRRSDRFAAEKALNFG